MKSGIDGLLGTLFDKAAPNLTTNELERISGSTADAMMLSEQMRDLCCGLACMVLADETAPLPSGSFNGARSVADLLYLLSASADQITGLLSVSLSAETELSIRRAAASRTKGSKA